MPRANRGPHLWRPKPGANWFVREFSSGRARARSTGTTDRRTAEAALARAILAAQQPAVPPDPTVAAVLSAYADARRGAITHRTITRICSYVAEVAGTWQASAITQRHVDRYVAARRAAGKAPNTIRTELGYLRAALRWAAVRTDLAPGRQLGLQLGDAGAEGGDLVGGFRNRIRMIATAKMVLRDPPQPLHDVTRHRASPRSRSETAPTHG